MKQANNEVTKERALISIEQAAAIDKLQEIGYRRTEIVAMLITKSHMSIEEMKKLRGMDFDTLITALYVGYNVKEYLMKENDYIISKASKNVYLFKNEIDTGYECEIVFLADETFIMMPPNNSDLITIDKQSVRRVTVSEELFARVGRKDKEFKNGDVLVFHDGKIAGVFNSGGLPSHMSFDEAMLEMDHGKVAGIFPIDNYVKNLRGRET